MLIINNYKNRLIKFKTWIINLIPLWIQPNHLTYLRISGSLIVLILNFLKINLYWLVITGIIISLSDKLDGLLARQRQQVTNLGSILDPIADKFLTSALIIILWNQNIISQILLLLTASTDIHALIIPILITLKYKQKKYNISAIPKIRPNYWGKLKTAWLISSMNLILLGKAACCNWLINFGTINLILGIGIGIIAITLYFINWQTGTYTKETINFKN